MVLLLVVTASANATLRKSTDWQQDWITYPFPPRESKTPLFLTRAVQLPDDIRTGDLVILMAQEEFSNPSAAAGPLCDDLACSPWNSLGAWRAGYFDPHWTTPIMMGCGLVKLAGEFTTDPAAWSWVGHPVAENFDGIAHHHVWEGHDMFEAEPGDAYVGTICYFARSPAFRDPDADYVQAHPDYGWVKAAVLSETAP